MAKHTTLPTQAIDHAADQAQAHLPTELPATPDAPPVPPTEVTLPDQALEHLLGVPGHLPDWLIIA
jgi:hypothetical protein